MKCAKYLTAFACFSLCATACGEDPADTNASASASAETTTETGSDATATATDPTEGTGESESDTTGDGDGDGDGDGSDTTSGSPWGQVSGRLYEDANGNGTRDDGELGVKSHRIFRDINDDGLWQEEEPYDVTDENGLYSFTQLMPGLYKFYLEPYKDIQTEPADVTEGLDDFEAPLDPAKWTVTGDNITVANGVLTITRDSLEDAAVLTESFEGSMDLSMKMRWDAQVDPESFIGVSVLAPCENANKQGVEVGRDTWSGNFSIRHYNCANTWSNYEYPDQIAMLATDYDVRIFVTEGAMGVMVDGVLVWDGDVGAAGPFAVRLPNELPSGSTTGPGTTLVIDDLAARSFTRLAHTLEVYAGDVINDAEFGRVTIQD
jgi:hypothetical protein